MTDEKKIYWETNVHNSDSDFTVYKSFDDAQEALIEEANNAINNHSMEELEKDGVTISFYIKPIRLTEEQFKKMLEEVE